MNLVFKAHTRLNMALQLLEHVLEKRRSMRSKESWTDRSIRTQRSRCRSRWRKFQINNLDAALGQFWSVVGLINLLLFYFLFLINLSQLFVCFSPLCDLDICPLVNKVVSRLCWISSLRKSLEPVVLLPLFCSIIDVKFVKIK